MKKVMLSIATVAFVALASCKKENTEPVSDADATAVETAEGTEFKVDTAASVINWSGSKPAGKHTGTISLKEGTFVVDTDGKVNGGSFVIDMTSITVTDLVSGKGKEDLEAHLKGTGEKAAEDHFFNTPKHPTGEFKLVSIDQVNGAYFVKGILTLKGISKEINFPAEYKYAESEITLHSDPFKINRTLWGVNYASKSIFDDLKDKFVDDEIELIINVKAAK